MKINRSPNPVRRWRLAMLGVALGGVAFVSTQAWRYERATRRLAGNADSQAQAPGRVGESVMTAAAEGEGDLSSLEKRLRAEFEKEASAEAMMERLARIAEQDPALAVDLAHALGRTDAEKAAWVTDLARQWTQRAPQAAWDWLGQLPPARLDQLAEGAVPATVFSVMAASAPTLLLTNVDRLLRTGETGVGVPPAVAVHLGLESLVEQGNGALARAAVERWAVDPAKPAIGSSAFLTVAHALRADDALGAAGWLQSLPASADRDEALTEFSAHWAQHAPAAALQWAESLPTAALQTAAVQRTFFDWVERDAAPATQWLGDYLARAPATPETDRLIEALINLGDRAKSSPAEALQWAGLLEDRTKRARYEEKIALRWSRDDPVAASVFVSSGSIIPEHRKSAVILRLREKKSADFEP